MCGICGIVTATENVDFNIVKSMNDTIAHRGPDDEGYLVYNSETHEVLDIKRDLAGSEKLSQKKYNLLIGHRRLSIIDVSDHGHQPFKDPSGRYFLILNGEIYNYIELKEILVQKGYKFTSASDTEVLLYLYLEYKEKCLEMLNGMWAFVILDTVSNTLFGSRDRFGVKPFYYYLDNKNFIFSSEIKGMIKAPQISREINKEAAFDYLTNGRLSDNVSTLFKNVIELEPSTYFSLDLNNFKFSSGSYYSLKFNASWEKFDNEKSENYVREIREKIFNSVNLRLRSDVKVGSCLSGGVDSSSIVCVIDELLKKNKISQVGDIQKVFTSCYPDSTIDETGWAAIVADSTASEWFKTFPTSAGLMEDLEKLVYVQDVPFGSTTIYSQYKVMQLASENGVKVLLDGQGGDELFTGYTYFMRPFYNEMLKNLEFSSLINEYKSIQNSPISKSDVIKALTMTTAKLAMPAFVKRKLFSMKVRENYLLNKNFYREYEPRLDLGKLIEITDLNHALHDQFTKTSLKELLKYEDRNSMNFSIEARTPFADDPDLIDYVFSIPSSYKIHNGWTKYLLRESMKGIIPDVIRNRTDKLGFATPEYNWLTSIKDDLKDYFTDDLNEYMETSKIVNNWNSIFDGQSKTGFTNIWRFINFAVWKKVYKM